MTNDAISVAPHAYKAVLETDRVRVRESRMAPGDRTEMHSHPELIAIAMVPGRFRFTNADAKPMEVDVPAGVPMHFPAVEHETENIGDTEAVVLLIELK